MADSRAVELRHEGRTYRASSREIFFQWAREHRISPDDSYRLAGTDKWIPVTANSELGALLDPENWWKVGMGDKTYAAPDWETVVRWAREGRLSTDVKVEGPKTPPGGILGKASPELSPYLREWVDDDPERQPVKVRFDGRVYIPGDIETLKQWICESRVPAEAEVSLKGDGWQPVTECEGIRMDLWPAEPPDSVDEGAGDDIPGTAEESGPPGPESPKEPPARETEDTVSATDGIPQRRAKGPFRISTSYGEDYVFEDPAEISFLLKRKRVNSFDEVRHPSLPGGAMFVSEFMREFSTGGGSSLPQWIAAGAFGAGGIAAIVLQQPDMQWMLPAGIAALAVSLVLLARIIWKR